MNKITTALVAGFMALGLTTGSLRAEEIIITEFEDGYLSWTNEDPSLYYTVQFRPNLDGEEYWDGAYRGLQDIQSADAIITVPVSMFWRVVGTASPQHTRTLSAGSTILNAGYYEATDLTTAAPSLSAENIRAGVTVFGVEGTYDPRRIIRLEGDLAFGEVEVGQSPARNLTIHNDGSAELEVTSIDYPEGFSGAWSGGVDPAGSQAVTVTFSPTEEKSYGGSLTVNSPAFSGTNTHACSGTGGTYLVIDLSAGPEAESYPVSYMATAPDGGWTDEYKTTKLVLRRIPAGTFTMGSPEDELGRYSNEAQRQVTLTKDYYIGVFQVTQKQWERVMGANPSSFRGDARPVERVSYFYIREDPNNSAISPNWPESSQVHVNSFMGKLRAKTGLSTLDLPTEAQWERAARAGTGTALNSGKNLTNTGSCPNMSEVGRYGRNRYDGKGGYSEHTTVGSYLTNSWGLYDMHGNVWEWCLDWYEAYHAPTTDPVGAATGSDRVVRGGNWSSDAGICRSANRLSSAPSLRSNSRYGFRLSRTLP